MEALYKDPSRSPAERVEDLLSRMGLEEKVGQLMQLNGQEGIERLISEYMPGSLLHLNGEDAAKAMKLSMKSRLGIPVIMADDGIHGHSFWSGATIFPTQLSMSSSWDPGLLERVARVTAREMRATGVAWTFSPVLCIARDLRWGRIDETFGEDPLLIGDLALAMIKGYQGQGLNDPEAVLATAKHFAGYSETMGGRDASEADISRRKLRSYFLPPFERAAKSGCGTFMIGYQSMDGIPATANRWLLRDVLRGEWGFPGVLVTDWNNVGNLVLNQGICANHAEAAALALKSGNDMIMTTPEFFKGAQEALERELIRIEDIDAAVRRVLLLKFQLGLFEDPGLPSIERIAQVVSCPAHRELNLEAARASLILLRNEGLLPAQPSELKRVALIGPNADNPLAQLGDWSLGSGQMLGASGPAHPRQSVVTVLDGLRKILPMGCALEYEKGCSMTETLPSGLERAVSLAAAADLTVLVLGDTIAFTGEGKSTATLELQGGQVELAKAVLKASTKVAVVLINSKPLCLPADVLAAPAILEAFNPGMQGGQAIAEALLGIINPCGKLTISIPFHVGQQPVFYNQTRGQHGDRYADMGQDPAFAFGFGLSYASFKISDLVLASDSIRPDGRLNLSVMVTNTGSVAGNQTIQLYIEDLVTSATWAIRELKAYAKIFLDPGQSRRVDLRVLAKELSIVDADGRRIVEPGEFRVLVGSSSRPADCLSSKFKLGD